MAPLFTLSLGAFPAKIKCLSTRHAVFSRFSCSLYRTLDILDVWGKISGSRLKLNRLHVLRLGSYSGTVRGIPECSSTLGVTYAAEAVAPTLWTSVDAHIPSSVQRASVYHPSYTLRRYPPNILKTMRVKRVYFRKYTFLGAIVGVEQGSHLFDAI